MDDLKPCPFCGGEAKHYHHFSHGGWSNTDSVCCTNEDCGCGTCLHETEASAIAAWNTRADALATRDARIAELTEQRDTALAAMQIIADRVGAAEVRATAAESRLAEAERVIAGYIARDEREGVVLEGDIARLRTATKFMEGKSNADA